MVENGIFEKLKYIKYMNGIANKPSIDALVGFEDQEGFLLDQCLVFTSIMQGYSVMIGTTDYKGYKGRQLGASVAGAIVQWKFVQWNS